MRKLLVFVALFLPTLAGAAIRAMHVSEAVAEKYIKLAGINFKGAYTGKSVRLSVTNLKNDSLDLTVDLGLILKPDDSSCQPMVLAGEEQLVLAPKQKGQVDVYVFCGNCPMHCPRKDMRYSYWKTGSRELVAVLRYINNHSLFDYLGQSAVWGITNDHAPTGIYDRQRDSVSKRLIDTFCLITGRPQPDYYTMNSMSEVPGQAAYTANTLQIYTMFAIHIATPTILSVGVFDQQNQMVAKLIDRRMFPAGRQNLDVTFNAEEFGAGKFTIRLMDSEKTLAEKKVESFAPPH